MILCAIRKRALVALAIAFAALTVGLVLVLLSPASSGNGNDHASSAGWIALVPIYTSLIPIYLAAARRRKNKKNDG